MTGTRIHTAPPQSSEERAANEDLRSPIDYVSAETLRELQGHIVAILADGPDKGLVVAKVRLNEADPTAHRRDLNTLIHASNYPDRNLQIRQVLADVPEEGQAS